MHSIIQKRNVKCVCDMIEVLAKTTVLIILQYINVSNQHTVYLKLIQCYMSMIPQF